MLKGVSAVLALVCLALLWCSCMAKQRTWQRVNLNSDLILAVNEPTAVIRNGVVDSTSTLTNALKSSIVKSLAQVGDSIYYINDKGCTKVEGNNSKLIVKGICSAIISSQSNSSAIFISVSGSSRFVHLIKEGQVVKYKVDNSYRMPLFLLDGGTGFVVRTSDGALGCRVVPKKDHSGGVVEDVAVKYNYEELLKSLERPGNTLPFDARHAGFGYYVLSYQKSMGNTLMLARIGEPPSLLMARGRIYQLDYIVGILKSNRASNLIRSLTMR